MSSTEVVMTDEREDWGTADLILNHPMHFSGRSTEQVRGPYRSIIINAPHTRSGRLTIQGDLAAQTFTINADTKIGGRVDIDGDLRIGTLNVSSTLTLRGSITVTGDVSIGTIEVPRGCKLQVLGRSTFNGVSIDKFHVDGEVDIASRVTAPCGFVIEELDIGGRFETAAQNSTAFTIDKHTGRDILYSYKETTFFY